MPDSIPAFIATARKYRPQRFGDILAQPGVTVTLRNALASHRVHHAYLFAGPRGTGKTTTARVLAKALNCKKLKKGEPCAECDPCREFQAGKSLDVIEIDGASNRGVDDIRNLRERVAYAAAGGGYKIYIVDEVHMLTHEAFNALLKTLEEPPPQVAFIFATTEPAKVPATIMSRCQHFDFRRIAPESITQALRHVAQAEKVSIDTAAIELLARRAQGSLRDALSLLDQTVAYAEGEITRAVAEEALGVISEDSLFRITELWAQRETAEAFRLLSELWEAGIDPGEWASAFGDHLRDLLAARVGGEASPGARFEAAAAPFELGDLLRAQVMLSDLRLRLRVLDDPRPEVEVYLLRLFTLADTVSLAQFLSGQGVLTAPGRGGTVAHPSAGAKDPGTGGAEAPTLDLKLAPRPAAAEPETEALPAEPWERFLTILRKKAPWAASELRRGRLNSQDDRLARFFVPDSNVFNRDRFGSAGIRKAVADAYFSVWGARPRIEFDFGETVRPADDTESLLDGHPQLRELIEATDGEIVARRPRKGER
jgi:DNA polymerase-3 subunit gamma/tau